MVQVRLLVLIVAAVILPSLAIEPNNFDVIVVGGGLSGMTAAYELNKYQANFSLLVLEAQNRLGGRALTVELPGPNGTDSFDMGAQWVGKTQYYVMYMLNQLGVGTYAQYMTGDKLQRMTANGTINRYQDVRAAILGNNDVIKLFGDIQNNAHKVGPEDPMRDAQAAEWNQMSVADYAQKTGWTQQNRAALDLVCNLIFDTTPDQVSMLFFLMFVNSTGDSFDTLTGYDGNGANAYKIANGAQALVEKIATGIPNVRSFRQVIRVRTLADRVEVETKEGDIKHARFVIMAVPPNKAAEISFEPALPDEKLQLLHSFVPKGTGYKFIFTYSTTWWRTKNLSGQVVSTAQTDATSTNPPLPALITYDATTSTGTPALIGFADFGHDYSKETRRQAYLSVMEQFFGDDVNHFLGFSDQEWSKDVYSKGCFAALAPGRMPNNISALLRSPTNGRVFWAGTETATIWMGYMNGAVQAGRRAAGEVLDQYNITHHLYDIMNDAAPRHLSMTLFGVVLALSLVLLLN